MFHEFVVELQRALVHMFMRGLTVAVGDVAVGPLAEADEHLLDCHAWIIPLKSEEPTAAFVF